MANTFFFIFQHFSHKVAQEGVLVFESALISFYEAHIRTERFCVCVCMCPFTAKYNSTSSRRIMTCAEVIILRCIKILWFTNLDKTYIPHSQEPMTKLWRPFKKIDFNNASILNAKGTFANSEFWNSLTLKKRCKKRTVYTPWVMQGFTLECIGLSNAHVTPETFVCIYIHIDFYVLFFL